MVKIDPTPCSALQGLALPGRYGAANGGPGVVLSERADLALAAVMVRKGASEALARRVRAVFGLDLPTMPRRAARGSLAFVWAGPGYWLAATAGRDGTSLEELLRHELSNLASISDQSDGRAVVRIAGARARDVLAKCSRELHLAARHVHRISILGSRTGHDAPAGVCCGEVRQMTTAAGPKRLARNCRHCRDLAAMSMTPFGAHRSASSKSGDALPALFPLAC